MILYTCQSQREKKRTSNEPWRNPMPLGVETRQIVVLVQKRFFDYTDTLDKASIEKNVALDNLQTVGAAGPNCRILKVDMGALADMRRNAGETATYCD